MCDTKDFEVVQNASICGFTQRVRVGGNCLGAANNKYLKEMIQCLKHGDLNLSDHRNFSSCAKDISF